jgi:hypothetical protein
MNALYKAYGARRREYPFYWIRFGRIEGVALGLIEVVEARGVAVSDDDRERALEAFHIEAIDDWIGRALTAMTIEEYLDVSPGEVADEEGPEWW